MELTATAKTQHQVGAPVKKRIQSIDLLRGIVMVIMAVDHTRDYFHNTAFTDDPLNLSTTTTLLFFTRWITHFCAPTFVFLSGVSAWLQLGRKTKKELSIFLITRGLWLMFLDLFVITLITTADIHYSYFVVQTLWSIGISMFVLGLLIHLPFYAILAIGTIIVFGHDSIDFAEVHYKDNVPFWWHLMHLSGTADLGRGHKLFILFPFVPWIGLMIMGYCCGKIFTSYESQQRNKILLRTGIALLAFFVILRFTNLYGDKVPWSVQKDSWHTFLSFIKANKYPPSLLYLCMTIGPGLIFLSAVKNTTGKLSGILIIYGRVPMFFYIIHFFVLSCLNIIITLVQGHSFAEGMKGVPGTEPWKFSYPGEGFGLAVVYLIWFLVVAALYPACKWYNKYKSTHPEKKWLSYL